MPALDIFIGLVLIYFLYALLISIVTEMCSTWIGMRARMLRQGLDNLLNDKHPGIDNQKDFVTWIKDAFLVEAREFRYTHAGRFYQEPTIKYLAKVGENQTYSNRYTKPSYISKENFTATILNMLGQKSPGINEWEKIKFAIEHNTLALEPDTLTMFTGWLLRSNDSYQQFIANIGRTYTEMMDRVNGWYKRKISLFIFWFGFLICMIMNVDSIQIVKILADDPVKRQEMVKLAIATIEAEDKFINDTAANRSIVVSDSVQYKKLKERYDTTMNSIAKSQLIMANGWVYPHSVYNHKYKTFYKAKHILSQSLPWNIKFWGLVITALALSLGAQFWFDLLKKLVALRGAGVKPEERPKDPLSSIPSVNDLINDGMATNTADPVEIALSQNRKYWESLKGVLGINASIKTNSIDIIVEDTFDINLLPSKLEIISGNQKTDIKIETTRGTLAQNLLGENGYIQLIGDDKRGSVCGMFKNLSTSKNCLLTCAHVLQKNGSSFFDKHNSNVQLINGDKLGSISNLISASFIDAALVDCDHGLPEKLISFGIKPVKKLRELNNEAFFNCDSLRISVVRDNQQKSVIGKLIDWKFNYTFSKANGKEFMYGLVLIKIDNTPDNTIEKGDSGSMIYYVDKQDITAVIPCGLLIGKCTLDNNNYALGISLSYLINVLQLNTL